MKTVYFDTFLPQNNTYHIITTTRYNFIEAALYILQNEEIEHLIQIDLIRREYTLYYHQTYIDFSIFDDNTTLKDVMLHYSIELPSFMSIVDKIHDLTKFGKCNIKIENYSPMIYKSDLINDTSIQGLLEFLLWGLYNIIVNQSSDNNNDDNLQQQDLDTIFLHGGGPSATLILGFLNIFLQSKNIKHFKGASMGSIIATYASIFPLHIFYDRFIDAVTKHLYPKNKSEEIVSPLTQQETLKFTRLFLGQDVCKMTLLQFYKTHLEPNEKTLDIIVTDISTSNYTIFNHITKPNVILEDALLCSCGVPFVIGIQEIDGKKYCDGDLFSYNYLQENPNMYRVLLTFQNTNTKTFDKSVFESFCLPGAPLHCVLESVEFYIDRYLERLDFCSKHPLTFNIPLREYLPMLNGTATLGSRQFHILNFQYGIE
jgi:hypothetical protein